MVFPDQQGEQVSQEKLKHKSVSEHNVQKSAFKILQVFRKAAELSRCEHFHFAFVSFYKRTQILCFLFHPRQF